MNTAPVGPVNRCERIVVTTGSGRVFDLGAPDSPFFKLRVLIYRIRRWMEK